MDIPLDQRNIIKILGIEKLSDERKISILNKVSELVQKRLLLRIIETLDENKQKEFETLVDSEDQGKITGFLKANVPEMDKWLVEEINTIKKDMDKVATDADEEMKK